MVELIEFMGDGILPLAGGSLDQSASFMHTAKWWHGETSRVEAELRGNRGS